MNNDLIDLREKYLRMRALRESRAHSEPNRADLRALAARWPGALAEIDRLDPSVLAHRITALDEAISGGEVPLWARAWILAHRRLRGALAIKAKLAGIRSDLPEESGLYEQRHDEIARPPNGKLTDLVFTDVARELSIAPDEIRRLLLPREPMH